MSMPPIFATAKRPSPQTHLSSGVLRKEYEFKSILKNIVPYVKKEILKATEAQVSGDYFLAFKYLENAHILGQESTYWHVKVHYLMMLWAIKQKNTKEVFGQVVRIIGAGLLTVIKRRS